MSTGAVKGHKNCKYKLRAASGDVQALGILWQGGRTDGSEDTPMLKEWKSGGPYADSHCITYTKADRKRRKTTTKGG